MRRVRLAAALTISAAVLAGCSGEQQANETLPSASSSPTSADALPPLGPPDFPMPDEAREKTPEGAEAFIRYYMDVYTAAQESMDPTYMDQLSQGCLLCDQVVANMRSDAEAGYQYIGGETTVESVTTGNAEDGKIELAFSMSQAALTVTAADGSELSELSATGADLHCGAVLNWSSSNSSWVLGQWDVN